MQYVCAKCGNTHYESDQFQATGGNFAKIFDIQNKSSSPLPAPAAATQSSTSSRGPRPGIFWTF